MSRKNTVRNILRETFSALGVAKDTEDDEKIVYKNEIKETDTKTKSGKAKSEAGSKNKKLTDKSADFEFPSNMSKVDSVRYFVYVAYLVPAKKRGQKTVSVRAGDVREALGFDNIPTICSALKTRIDSLYDAKILSVNPKEGNRVSTTVQYGLEDLYIASSPKGKFNETGSYSIDLPKKYETEKDTTAKTAVTKKTTTAKTATAKTAKAKATTAKAATAKTAKAKATTAKTTTAKTTTAKTTTAKTATAKASFVKNSEGIVQSADSYVYPEECYLELRNLEESLRNFVSERLVAQFGKSWWTKTDMEFLAKRWEERRIIHDRTTGSQTKNKSENLIMFASFSDYRRIINNPFAWKVFEEYFPDRNWIVQRLKELDPIRNAIMHHTPLEEDDIIRLGLYSRDIKKAIK